MRSGLVGQICVSAATATNDVIIDIATAGIRTILKTCSRNSAAP
jgi:hypothetical protein